MRRRLRKRQVMRSYRSAATAEIMAIGNLLLRAKLVAQRGQNGNEIARSLEVRNRHEDVQDRLGRQAGDRGTADVMHVDDVGADRSAQLGGRLLEQLRPAAVVGNDDDGSAFQSEWSVLFHVSAATVYAPLARCAAPSYHSDHHTFHHGFFAGSPASRIRLVPSAAGCPGRSPSTPSDMAGRFVGFTLHLAARRITSSSPGEAAALESPSADGAKSAKPRCTSSAVGSP